MPVRFHCLAWTVFLPAFFLAVWTNQICAQADRAELLGTVFDAAGKVLPGVHVTATLPETGAVRETRTSRAGSYQLPQLQVGTYKLVFEQQGFARLTFDRVIQAEGMTRTLNATLEVAGGNEQIEVNSQTSELDATSDALGGRAEAKQVESLPLNGRNWSTLTALVPGAVDTGGSTQRSIRFAGRGLDDNNFVFDGVDASNIVNQAQQPFVRIAIPTDSIEEFHIETMLFTADNGSTPGAQIAVASKSGSNQLHGGVFEFFRNDIFDAREPINPIRLPLRLNQFGGGIGGPVARNRTFFYFNYEGLRQSYGQPLVGLAPSPAFRAQVAAADPALAPLLKAYPADGLTPGSNPDQDTFTGSGSQLDHEDSGMIRLDHRFSAADAAYIRFNFDAAYSDAPLVEGGSFLTDRQLVTSRPVNGELEALHIFSPTLINELKFGFNRGNVYTTNQGLTNIPYTIAVPGFTTLAGNQFKIGVGNSFSYIDNLTKVLGPHTLKFGAEVRRIQLNQGNTASGTIAYSSAVNFLANSISSATYAQALPVNGLRKNWISAFAEDEWKYRPNLTLNLGVRYIFYSLFHEVNGKAIPFDFATCGPRGFCGAGASFGHANTLDIDPRISITWAPSALHGKTIVRSGFGIYHGDGQLDDQNLPISNEVGQYSLSSKTTDGLSYPVTPFLNGPGTVSARDDDRNRKDMYVSQWGVSLQQALAHDFVGTLSYVGSKGTYLLTTSYVNLIDPVAEVRPYSTFGQVQYRGNTNNSSYQGLVASLQRSFTHGLLFSLNYTYSHEIDEDSAGGGDSDFPENPACFPCERTSGDFDVRHVVTANVVYELPFGRGKQFLSRSGFTEAVFGHWTATDIVAARTGLPINVTEDRSSTSVATGYTTSQRPNLLPGVSLTPPGGKGIHHWINPAAFVLVPSTDTVYGDAPRNAARALGLWQTDLGLSKRIPLGDQAELVFKSEFFNLFNRAQYGLPQADFSSSSFGNILNTVNAAPVGTGTPRQIQFALRLQF